MLVLNETTQKVVIEFTKKEYYQISNWLIGKKAGKIPVEVRDALENFIAMSTFLNPSDLPLKNK